MPGPSALADDRRFPGGVGNTRKDLRGSPVSSTFTGHMWPDVRAPCETRAHAGPFRALPAHVVARSTGGSPARDDGSGAERAAGLRSPPSAGGPGPLPRVFTRTQHPFPECGQMMV
ncbi:hypothetical protein GCM10010269_07660 [Streptomyces humidus]|uniref:Uncharacterized protein n=1 Tax=Streptomyces humidus TaxID=52259 RepID=A0A918L1E7_9ACTN|nr:hypothetical protein GCM10010269_07660 [Streptomyces humidus]